MTRKIEAFMGFCALIVMSAGILQAAPKHGISMYGEPALPQDFVHLPQANPDAPKGGRVIFGEGGGFDSMNPYILKGRAPWGVRVHTVESLMGRNWDEPFALYGLLAETIETPEDRSWVAFTLRDEARFSDGAPVTIEDVIWSFETLGTKGHPRYQRSWDKIADIVQSGPKSVKISFAVEDRELAILMGLRPILKKSDWEGRDFEESSLDIVTGSGPYIVDDFEPGRFISFKRNEDYWGKDLPFNKGQHNLDEIRYEYFTDGSVIFEAFKAGEISTFREGNAKKWETAYNFPRVESGEIIKSIVPHQRPSGITGFVMNMRNPIFADWRVREAMIQAFNFEFINKSITDGRASRITSYFSNSILGMEEGPAEGAVQALLLPFKDALLPGVLEGYSLPEGRSEARDRNALKTARGLLEEAGWRIKDGRLTNELGEAFTFEVLLNSSQTEEEAIMNMYFDALNQLGIFPTLKLIDSAQLKERVTEYKFDMTYYRRGLSLSPGNEQKLYWGAEGVTKPGTRNYMGMDVPAAEAMIDAMLKAPTRDEFVAATRALDRILTAGRYVIPLWHNPQSRLAHDARLRFPDRIAMYGDWLGFLPEVWWFETK